MSLHNKLGLDPIKIQGTSLYGVQSLCGVGKTTILCMLAVELLMEGKNILFLTNDYNPTYINHKLRKFYKGVDFTGYQKTTKINNLEEDLDKLFQERKFDVIFIDNLPHNESIEHISKKYNCIVWFSQHERRFTCEFDYHTIPNKVKNVSDFIVSINRKTDFNFWIRIKYFLLFWLKKPNRNLTILKNRYGKEGNVDVFIDFEDGTID